MNDNIFITNCYIEDVYKCDKSLKVKMFKSYFKYSWFGFFDGVFILNFDLCNFVTFLVFRFHKFAICPNSNAK